jgi:hypothetical protein
VTVTNKTTGDYTVRMVRPATSAPNTTPHHKPKKTKKK